MRDYEECNSGFSTTIIGTIILAIYYLFAFNKGKQEGISQEKDSQKDREIERLKRRLNER